MIITPDKTLNFTSCPNVFNITTVQPITQLNGLFVILYHDNFIPRHINYYVDIMTPEWFKNGNKLLQLKIKVS